MVQLNTCPICGLNEFEEFIDFGEVPGSAVFLTEPNGNSPSLRIAFEFCTECALIRRRRNEVRITDYQAIARPSRNQIPEYASDILSQLIDFYPKRNGFIIEVGGNDGTFLDAVSQAGYTKRLNIEPSVSLAEISRKTGHPTENVPLDLHRAERIKRRYGAAEVVLCRHVLGQIPDPVGFLSAVHWLLKEDGLFFLEIPNSRGIYHELLGHELWNEHFYFFTYHNIVRLLEYTGFLIKNWEVKPHRGGTNLLFWTQAMSQRKISHHHEKQVNYDVQACRDFKKRWSVLSLRLVSLAHAWQKPIAGFGASHPQSNYYLFTKLGSMVSFLVDDDPHKIGNYLLLPQPVPIISTEQLMDHTPVGTLIRSAFGCDSWMDPVCRIMADRGVACVDPYPINNHL